MDQAVTYLQNKELSRYAKKRAKDLLDWKSQADNSKGFVALAKKRAEELKISSDFYSFQEFFNNKWKRQGNKNPDLRTCDLITYAVSFGDDKVIIKMWGKETICHLQVVDSNIGLEKNFPITLHDVLTFPVAKFFPHKTLDKEKSKSQKRIHTFLRMVLERQDSLIT